LKISGSSKLIALSKVHDLDDPRIYALRLQSKVLDMLNTAVMALNTTDYKYDASYFFTAGYDSPFRLINRHNEVNMSYFYKLSSSW
jgi:hypothetical protein